MSSKNLIMKLIRSNCINHFKTVRGSRIIREIRIWKERSINIKRKEVVNFNFLYSKHFSYKN